MPAPLALVQAVPQVTALPGGFGWLDGAVVIGILVLTTWLGHKLAGKQNSARDFFLGGRRLPWPAVAASIIATEISAVTFVSLPSVVARPGGNITYLQIGLFGSLIARALVAWLLVPRYYEAEIYSPYDWMGRRLGEGVRRATTALFAVGGVLGQASRVYLAAVIVEVLLYEQLHSLSESVGGTPILWAIIAIGLVAVVWTWMGGIATVVWTDALLFLLFIAGIVTILLAAFSGLEAGVFQVFDNAWEAGKLRLIAAMPPADSNLGFWQWMLTDADTLWAALFFASWGMVGPYGTDQMMVQRLLCCTDLRSARKAMLASYAAMLVTVLVAAVGIALWAWYDTYPPNAELAGLLEAKRDRTLPLFVREVLPDGLRGLVFVGALAAAISSLDSVLAALSQTTLHTFWQPLQRWYSHRAGAVEVSALPTPQSDRKELFASRVLVLVWAVLLCGAAYSIDGLQDRFKSLLHLALASAGFTGGALLAAFALACMPLREKGAARGAEGFLWAAPLSVLTVVYTKFHSESTHAWSFLVVGVILCLWVPFGLARRPRPYGVIQTLILAFYLFLLTRLAEVGAIVEEAEGVKERSLEWPFYVPLGSLVAFTFSFVLDRPNRR
jgi:SSS family solute:Na+ symporter